MTYLKKSLIDPHRVRKIPESFSWMDRRFLNDGYLEHLPQNAALLYFFLAAVSDKDGLSFYGDRRILQLLQMNQETLESARKALVTLGLIAWQKPLYQVLALFPHARQDRPIRRSPVPIGEILKTQGIL